jgi:uncharacterized phage protein gp47/JayE
MARPEFIPVFEESESTIKDRLLGRVSDEWRKEQGDFMYDAVVPAAEEIKQLQVNQDTIIKNGHPQYADGEDLDLLLAEVGLTRFAATPNKRAISVQADAGVTLAAGHTVTALLTDEEGNPIEYTIDASVNFAAAGTQAVNITAVSPGTVGNVATGSEFTLVPPVPGVRTLTDAGTTLLGTDTETDEAAYDRYDFKVKNPDTGGNKNDYKRWALEVTGVGDAKIVPRWNGNGSVKVILVDTDKAPAAAGIVTAAQNYLDPGQTGLGDGKAPCGALVTVVAATAVTINVTATVTYYSGADTAAVKADFTASLLEYLKEISFEDVPVVIAKVGSLLIGTYGVANYTGLTINGGTADIPLGSEQVPVLGAVTI